MFKETNHAQPPSKGRFKPSLPPCSASSSKTMIWKSSYAKRTQGLTLRRKTKKVLMLKEGTKKGWKVAMPQALKGRVSSNLSDLVHRIDLPFTASINSFIFLPKFYML